MWTLGSQILPIHQTSLLLGAKRYRLYVLGYVQMTGPSMNTMIYVHKTEKENKNIKEERLYVFRDRDIMKEGK